MTFNEAIILNKETIDIAKTEDNMKRNRYRDVVPFDSNIVYLSRETGDPPSTYINASEV